MSPAPAGSASISAAGQLTDRARSASRSHAAGEEMAAQWTTTSGEVVVRSLCTAGMDDVSSA
eukprot:scaffold2014_cov112-Isochrysis_galbana.AAC.8